MKRLRISMAALTALCVLALATAALADRDVLLDKGLVNAEPYAFYLIEKARAAKGDEKAELINEALLAAPGSPAVHFAKARADLPNVISSIASLIAGVQAYSTGIWWSLSLMSLLFASALAGIFVSFAIIAFIVLPKDLPLFVHDINESKGKLLIALLPLGMAVLGPVPLIGSLMLIAGFYIKKSDKWVVYAALLFAAAMPFMVKGLDKSLASVTPDNLALVAVNEGRDNTLALNQLHDKEGFVERFTYALALKREGWPGKAAQIYAELANKSTDPRVFNNLGSAYIYAGMRQEGKEAFKESLAKRETVITLFNLSQIHRDELNYTEGDKYYDKAFSKNAGLVSYYNKISGKTLNRLVIDATLDYAELMSAVRPKNARTMIGLYPVGTMPAAGAGAALLVLFVILDKRLKKRSFRCTKCNKVACALCSDQSGGDQMCSECQSAQGADEDTSAKARVARMLSANEEKNRLLNRIRALSFLPPGIAQTFSGRVSKGFIYMVLFYVPLAAVIMNPFMRTGMETHAHTWLTVLFIPYMMLVYYVSFLTVNRRLDRGWL